MDYTITNERPVKCFVVIINSYVTRVAHKLKHPKDPTAIHRLGNELMALCLKASMQIDNGTGIM